MPREEIDAFFETVPASFTDPLTGVRARSERELTAVLAVKHHFKELRWSAVPMRSRFPLEPQGDTSSVIDPGDHVFCEYPLFVGSPSDLDRWGGMAPDLLFLSADRQRVTLVECKVDSHFTHSDNPPNGQLSRYLEFLHHAPLSTRSLLLICPACNQDWYAKRLASAAEQARCSEVLAALATWEQVFDATQASFGVQPPPASRGG